MHLAAGVHGVDKHLFFHPPPPPPPPPSPPLPLPPTPPPAARGPWIYACMEALLHLRKSAMTHHHITRKKSGTRSRRCVYILFVIVRISFLFFEMPVPTVPPWRGWGGQDPRLAFWTGLGFWEQASGGDLLAVFLHRSMRPDPFGTIDSHNKGGRRKRAWLIGL